jgi:hypothetical protein
VYILHRTGNTASINSLANIQAQPLTVPIDVLNVSSMQDVETKIGGTPANSGGLLVLPVDLFFGAANEINQLAKGQSLPVCWPLTDWVPPGNVGFGVAQETCGEAMGKQIQYIFENNKIPSGNQRFVTLGAAYRTWGASKAAAAALGVKLATHRALRVV